MKKKKETQEENGSALLKALEKAGIRPSPPPDDSIKVVATGLDSFDNDFLQIGGVPLGRFIEVLGPPGSGKSNFALRILGQAQKQYPDKLVAYIDAEARFTKDWARRQGVDVDLLQYHRTNVVEEIGFLINQYVSSGLFSVIVLDSLGNTLTSTSLNFKEFYQKKGETIITKEQPGAIAKLVTRFMQQVTVPAAQNDTLVLVVNQLRDKIGVLYGSTETTPGGNNFGHDLTMRLRFAPVGKDTDIVENGEVVGMRSAVTIQKHTLGRANIRTDDGTHFELYFDNGVEKSKTASIFSKAIRQGIIVKAGGWYSIYNPETGEQVHKLQGEATVKDRCMNDPEFRAEIESYIGASDATYGDRPTEIPENLIEQSGMYELLDE